LQETTVERVVDLCAGSGGPWPELIEKVAGEKPLAVYLTDKFPRSESADGWETAPSHRIEFVNESIDAGNVPNDLRGFRTIFNSFHHFEEEQAKRLLRNATERQEGVGVFELPQRDLFTVCSTVFMGIGSLIFAPFSDKTSAGFLFWTYVIPVLPLVLWLDGLLSCLRAYTAAEMLELAKASSADYRWEAGTLKSSKLPLKITYLIGVPRKDAAQTVEAA
jgi:hypothetical protein